MSALDLTAARRDVRAHITTMLDIAAIGQRALQAVGSAEVSKAYDMLALMLASFRNYEATRERRDDRLAIPRHPCAIGEHGTEGGHGEILSRGPTPSGGSSGSKR